MSGLIYPVPQSYVANPREEARILCELIRKDGEVSHFVNWSESDVMRWRSDRTGVSLAFDFSDFCKGAYRHKI